jgi:hypothetical protein
MATGATLRMISSALQDAIGAALLPWVFLTGSMRESGAAYG